jgi:hypothetical protein
MYHQISTKQEMKKCIIKHHYMIKKKNLYKKFLMSYGMTKN